MQAAKGFTRRETQIRLRSILPICGILASLLFASTDLLAGTLWQGYSFASRSISELSAVGAPTRPLVVTMGIAYDGLMIAFGWGVWRSASRGWAQRATALMIVLHAILSLAAVFFPLHSDEAVYSAANNWNTVVMGTSVGFFLLAIGFGAVAYRSWFRVYSAGILLLFLVATILGLTAAPEVAAATRAPWVGIAERTMVCGYLLWVVLLAIGLLRPGRILFAHL